MPRAKRPEFRRRAVELARLREKPIREIASDLGIAESCLRPRVAQPIEDVLSSSQRRWPADRGRCPVEGAASPRGLGEGRIGDT